MTRRLARRLARWARWWLTLTYCRPEQRHHTWWPVIVDMRVRHQSVMARMWFENRRREASVLVGPNRAAYERFARLAGISIEPWQWPVIIHCHDTEEPTT